MKTALILGAGGGLGNTYKCLGPQLRPQWQWISPSEADADITKPHIIRGLLERHKPHAVFNASGYTAVDKAELEKEQAYLVNATAVGSVSQMCADRNICFVHISTDYVFSGDGTRALTETDQPQPQSVYGKSKWEGEKLALAYPTSIVLRTSWLYSEYGKSFPLTILRRALESQPLKVVDDQISSPTWAADLAQASCEIVDLPQRGLFHYSGLSNASWWDLAAQTLDKYSQRIGKKLTEPSRGKTEDLQLPAPRPRFSKLDCTKISTIGITPRSWEIALDGFLDNLIQLGSLQSKS